MLSVVGEESVSPNTEVFYISQQYSLVFVLDMTPTMVQVVCTGMIVYTTYACCKKGIHVMHVYAVPLPI